jgi:hypothetical protein
MNFTQITQMLDALHKRVSYGRLEDTFTVQQREDMLLLKSETTGAIYDLTIGLLVHEDTYHKRIVKFDKEFISIPRGNIYFNGGFPLREDVTRFEMEHSQHTDTFLRINDSRYELRRR